MNSSQAPLSDECGSAGKRFEQTQWSLILTARDEGAPGSAEALEKFARIYWPPLYAYLRRIGHSPHDAQDLTQEFLSRFLHRDGLDHLKDRRAKFRSFLLTFLNNFLSDQRDRAHAQKRGGGKLLISMDAYEAEEREAMAPAGGLTAEQLYERRWARAVMAEAIKHLEAEYAARGKSALFGQLKDLQPGERGEQRYADIAALLGTTEQAIKNARHAFNRRYGELMRKEIARTVDPAELEAEVQHLIQVFSS
jgi:RNA polymerase sigma factor (sigma-70 family)